MKKIIAFVLVLITILSFAACSNSNSNTSNDDYTNGSSYKKELSKSEAEDIALDYLCREAEKKYCYGYKKYSLDNIQYTITSTDNTDNHYHFYGKLYIYDDYGDLAETAKFNFRVNKTHRKVDEWSIY